jgi:hypothetical protein
LGLKEGDTLGMGLIGPPIPQARIISINELLARLRDLADKWAEECNRDPWRHGDAWCRAKDDCAEELKAVLRGS